MPATQRKAYLYCRLFCNNVATQVYVLNSADGTGTYRYRTVCRHTGILLAFLHGPLQAAFQAAWGLDCLGAPSWEARVCAECCHATQTP